MVPEVLLFLNQDQVTIFQQDNAQQYTARQTQDVLLKYKLLIFRNDGHISLNITSC
jgi:hypothetical protein